MPNLFERIAHSIPDPIRRILLRNRLVWRLRNATAKTITVNMASPLDGCVMQLPRWYVRYYGVEAVERDVVAFLQRHVPRGAVVADVGTFAGYYTLLLSRLVGPEGRVHAFEPVPENFEMATANIRQNVRSNVELNQVAVGAKDGEAVFQRLKALYMPYGGLLTKQDESRHHMTVVNMRSLDSYLSERGWPPLALAKIDVEASEADVVEGMEEAIRRFSPVLLIEVHDGGQHDRERARRVLPRLFQSGYRVFCLEDDTDLRHPLRSPGEWSGHKHCVALPQ
jgi:FkbM family methyltransferase